VHPCRSTLLVLLVHVGVGCAYISDEHAAWREDPDADGTDWTIDCDESDPKVAEPLIWFADQDADGFGDSESTQIRCEQPEGFVLVDGDCDDLNPRIRPGAHDRCNTIDDDCDGKIDEDATLQVFYTDSDDDGFGDSESWERACAQPPGMVDNEDDCDDSIATDNPSAPELCDGRDNNCDGVVDEEPTDAPTWYRDADGDGYGNPESSSTTCEVPAGFVDNADDCDDTDSTYRLRGETEIFFNGLEDNCDPWDGDGDEDGDRYWDENYEERVLAGEFTPMPIPDDMGGDCNDSDDSIYPGAIELPDSTIDANCDGGFGADSDGDGHLSIAAGGDDCDDSNDTIHPGASENCYDGVDSDCDGADNPEDCRIDDLAEASVFGESDGDAAGSAISVTDDGMMIIGAPGYDSSGGTDLGAVYLMPPEAPSMGGGELRILGGFDDGALGTAVIGLADGRIALSAPGTTSGEVYLWDPAESTPTDIWALPNFIADGTGGENFGATLAAGRVLDDGAQMLIIGAPDRINPEVWIITPPSGGPIDSSEAHAILQTDSCSELGHAIAAVDLTGSGIDELVLGIPDYEASAGGAEGAVIVLEGSLSAGLQDIDDVADATISGETRLDRFGSTVATADMDGDGLEDLLIGAEQAGNTSADEDPGAVYIHNDAGTFIFGTTDPSTALWGDAAGDRTGGQIVAQDVDGDGAMDLWISAPGADGPEAEAGLLYLVLGPIDEGEHELLDRAALVVPGDEGGGHLGDTMGHSGSILLIGAPDASGGSGNVMTIQSADLSL
jgi:hypothetical protein